MPFAQIIRTNTTQGQTDFSFTFPFIKEEHIKLFVNFVEITQGTGSSEFQVITNVTPNVARLNTGLASANTRVEVRRVSSINTVLVDFEDGATLTAADLDRSALQSLFIAQELDDALKQGISIDQSTGLPTLGSQKLTNVADPTNAQDVVTKAFLERAGSITTTQILDGTIVAGDIAAGAIVDSKINASAAIQGSKLQAASSSNAGAMSAADKTKLDAIESNAKDDQTAAEIRTLVGSASDSNVLTDALLSKLNAIESNATADQTNAEIRAAVEAATDSNVFTDADHTKLNNIEANAKDDLTASEVKTLYESNSNTNALTDAEKLVIDGVTANTGELNKLDGFTGSTGDLNQISGMSKQTSITNTDNAFPTSKAVVDFVANQIAPVGGLEVIADEDSFPATQPVSGVVISIANIDGLIVNSSGVASNARTVGSGSDNVTINNFPASLRNKTMAAELGLLVSSTGASQIYNYHKLLAKEADVEQLSNDINDFAARYRVVSSNPTSDNDAGDLIFNTSTQKLLVYNSVLGVFEEAQSVGNFFISSLSPAFDGSTQNFTVTNAPANAQQILLSINGVIQKPNAGTSTPSEGFALDGSTIKLAAAPASGSDAHVVVLGSTVNIGTPSNNTVTSAMIVDGSIVNGDISPSAAIEGTKITPTINKPIQHLYTGNTITFTVTVASKDATHRYNGTGSGNGYKIDGKFAPYLKLIAGITYRFDQSDGSNSGHPLRFYLEANKTTAYTTNVTTNGTAGSSGAYTQILITDTTPATLHYQCSAHGYMGNSAETGGLVDLANLSASNLTSGTIPDARFPATLPAINGANLTGINTDLVSDSSPQLGGQLQSNGQHINLEDNDKLKLGTNGDTELYHNNTDGRIENHTGDLYITNIGTNSDDVHIRAKDDVQIKVQTTENAVICNGNGSVELYYDGSKKFETTATGVSITGNTLAVKPVKTIVNTNQDHVGNQRFVITLPNTSRMFKITGTFSWSGNGVGTIYADFGDWSDGHTANLEGASYQIREGGNSTLEDLGNSRYHRVTASGFDCYNLEVQYEITLTTKPFANGNDTGTQNGGARPGAFGFIKYTHPSIGCALTTFTFQDIAASGTDRLNSFAWDIDGSTGNLGSGEHTYVIEEYPLT